MHYSQEFDDLNDLVAELRGRIGREALLLHVDEPWAVGTVIDLDISLAGEGPLIRGTAGVIRRVESRPGEGGRQLVVLEFLELDRASEAFVERLVARFESEGATPIRLDHYVWRGRRGPHQASGGRAAPPAPAPASEPPPLPPQGENLAGDEPSHHHRRRPGRGWWALAAALGALSASLGTIQLVRVRSNSPVPAIDPGPLLGASVGSPPDQGPLPPAASVEAVAGEPSPPSTRPLPEATRIQRISWRQASAGTTVIVEADGRLDPRAVSVDRIDGLPRPRLVVYLQGIASGDVAYRTDVGGPCLEAIRVWYHDDRSPVQVHVVLDLAGPGVAASQPVLDGRRLQVVLAAPRSGDDPSEPARVEPPAPAGRSRPVAEDDEPGGTG